MVKIGLEIHGYLMTKEKLFCTCKAEHGLKHSKPNVNICPVCTGQPGAKPMLPNKVAVDKAIQISLILKCKNIGGNIMQYPSEAKKRCCPLVPFRVSEIGGESTRETGGSLVWQRKHYSWPDLPKGYQNTISGPHAKPVGVKGEFLGIGITEAHLEEDPAAWNPKTGEIDYNRSGSPLIEIVTDPDFKNSKEVIEWLKQLIATLGYIKAIDKKLGVKVDVNVSTKGERAEIKNINSLNNIKNAIEYEIKRQEKEIPTILETRRFDETKGITMSMRTKEGSKDYRFVSEPDLPVIKISRERVEKIKKSLPETPNEKLKKLIKKHNIDEKSAEILTKKLEIVEFFEKVVEKINPKLVLQWITVELLGILNYNKKEMHEVEIKVEHFIELLKLLEKKTITELKAKEILRKFVPKSFSPKKEAEKNSKISGEEEIEKLAKQVIQENEKAVNDYKNGEEKAINFLIGQVMRLSDKRADFKTAKEILKKLLD